LVAVVRLGHDLDALVSFENLAQLRPADSRVVEE
jgi:hypothetical protein